jgi:aminoglycoside phosphotransferase (APT) family kinase protein
VSHSPPGPPIGSGRNADVYDIGGGRVLRRYRDGRGQDSVAAEAAVMEHARAHGVPVPEVFQVRESEIVMERAAGPTMLEALFRRPWTVRRWARQLADLHVLVHAVPALDRLPAPFDGLGGEGREGGQSSQSSQSGQSGQGREEVLLHRDLHPHNVIMTAAGPRIIDWEGAARGPAAADVAMTWVIVAFSEPPGSRLRALAVRPLRALFAREFLRAAGRQAPVDRGLMEAAVAQRLKDSNLLPLEKARLERLKRSGRIPGR